MRRVVSTEVERFESDPLLLRGGSAKERFQVIHDEFRLEDASNAPYINCIMKCPMHEQEEAK